MNIVVDHLTRMQIGYFCVAGIDTVANAHARPVIARTRLRTNLLQRNGGVFDIASEIDLGSVANIGRAPEVEDQEFSPAAARIVRRKIPSDEFWELLLQNARLRLRDIFGSDLEKAGRSAAIPVGGGQASLGCFQPPSIPQLRVANYNGKEKLELILEDFDLGRLTVAVTDIRFYQHVDHRLRRELVDLYTNEMQKNVPIILSTGVARKYKKPGDSQERHWLQVNNVHVESISNKQDRSCSP